jgi:nucleoside-diphosphate-sugar epimerase
MATKVLVTGASGYIAGHVCKQLVDAGFRVIGTVRSKSKAKTDHLERMGVEVVAADLLTEQSFDAAMDGCKYVQHCASPFFFTTPGGDPQNFIKPAVDGTLNVLDSARANGVERVVLTSSCAAVSWADAKSHPEGESHVWNEDDWQMDNTNENGPYRLSKRLAEAAAWDFVQQKHPNNLELVTILPSFVLGPPPSARADAASVQFMQALLDGSMRQTGPSSFGVVDVRDVALAHINAMTKEGMTPNMYGQFRYIVSSEKSFPQQDLADMLTSSGEFAAYRIPTSASEPPSQNLVYSNSKAREELAIDFLPVEQVRLRVSYFLATPV